MRNETLEEEEWGRGAMMKVQAAPPGRERCRGWGLSQFFTGNDRLNSSPTYKMPTQHISLSLRLRRSVFQPSRYIKLNLTTQGSYSLPLSTFSGLSPGSGRALSGSLLEIESVETFASKNTYFHHIVISE